MQKKMFSENTNALSLYQHHLVDFWGGLLKKQHLLILLIGSKNLALKHLVRDTKKSVLSMYLLMLLIVGPQP